MCTGINEVKHRPKVHKDTGVSQSTHDKVASPPSPHCQHVLVNQSVISSSHVYRRCVADVTQGKWNVMHTQELQRLLDCFKRELYRNVPNLLPSQTETFASVILYVNFSLMEDNYVLSSCRKFTWVPFGAPSLRKIVPDTALGVWQTEHNLIILLCVRLLHCWNQSCICLNALMSFTFSIFSLTPVLLRFWDAFVQATCGCSSPPFIALFITFIILIYCVFMT